MEHISPALLARISRWPDLAQTAAWSCRTVFFQRAAANDVGPLEEALKWGQPAWRPKRPRTGSTLRLDWSAHSPHHLSLFVDCKTDLAERMATLYPAPFTNDGRRLLSFPLNQPLPEQALSHLADMTFTYHRERRTADSIGQTPPRSKR